MLKLLKWNFLNYINKFYGLYISFFIMLVFAALCPRNNNYICNSVLYLCGIYSHLFYLYTIFISVATAAAWLQQDSSQLEMSLSVQSWKILLSKLTLSFAITISGMLLSRLLWKLLGKFRILGGEFYHGLITGFIVYAAIMTILIFLFLFSFLFVNRFYILRKFPNLAAIIFFQIICILLFVLLCYFYSATDIWHVEYKGSLDGIYLDVQQNTDIDATQQWLKTISYSTFTIVLCLISFFGSCSLLKKKFDILRK